MGDARWTREQAIAFAESGAWREMTDRQRVETQFAAHLICMPFSVFHESIEKVLGRPIWTHEFGLNWDGLRAEVMGNRPAPTMREILEMIPAEKRIVIAMDASARATGNK